MTPATAKLIRIGMKRDASGVFSSSPDMKGLVTTGDTYADVLAKLPEVIALTFKALGENVEVYVAEMASGADVGPTLQCSAMFVVVPQNREVDHDG